MVEMREFVDALSDSESLERNGFVVLKKTLSLEAANSLRELCMHEKRFAEMQEIPKEYISSNILRENLSALQKMIMRRISKRLSADCRVPETWEETMYIRRKAQNEYTPVHVDATNLVCERNLISLEEAAEAFTFWIPLTNRLNSSSWLSVDRYSHVLPFEIRDNAVISPGYDWKKRMSTRVTVHCDPGDCIVFNSLTMHSASLHRSRSLRLSIDGRFILSKTSVKAQSS